MNKLALAYRHNQLINQIMVKRAGTVTLNIPYSDDEIERMTSLSKTKRSPLSAKILDVMTGAALGGSAGSFGMQFSNKPESWPIAALIGAGIGGTALGIKGPYAHLFRGAASEERKELKKLLSKLQADNTIPTTFTDQQLDNMRRLQDSWIQPKANRNFWKKALKAYDEQVGLK